MSNKKNKKSSIFSKQNTQYYVNVAVVLFFLVLAGVLAKIFIFDTIKPEEELKKEVRKSHNTYNEAEEHHKYEEKTKALEIEYSDSNEATKHETKNEEQKIVKQEDKNFHFFDATTQQNNTEKKIVEMIASQPTVKQVDTHKEQSDKKQKNESIAKEKLETTTKKTSEKKVVTGSKDGKARLAIVIDDITTQKQFTKIQNLGFPITMAFLPPTSMHKQSASIAQSLPFYMVHLPLEAKDFGSEEANTLHVGDDISTIEKRIQELKTLYPNARYYNNHTGSKFTQDDDAMDKLMQVMKRHNLTFVDSRTTSKSVVKKYAQKYGVRYIGRNVFLDNTPSKEYIIGQLQKAVDIAKTNGSAIAIGHPYSQTIEALQDSKELLSDVEIVLLNKI